MRGFINGVDQVMVVYKGCEDGNVRELVNYGCSRSCKVE